MEQSIKEFRPIHYLGSKLRILDTIGNTIDQVDPEHGRVCDLFAGSGTVSYYLGKKRDVTAIDIQEYSRVLCSAALNPVQLSMSPTEVIEAIKNSDATMSLREVFYSLICYERLAIESAKHEEIENLYDIIENGSIVSAQLNGLTKECSIATYLSEAINCMSRNNLDNTALTMVTRYFGGLYFSYEQAVCVDAALAYIHSQAPEFRDSLLAPLLGAVSEIVDTVGKQFAQPLQVRDRNGNYKRNLKKKIIEDRTQEFWRIFENWLNVYNTLRPMEDRRHHIHRLDYREALKTLQAEAITVVYADPPYTRYHYSRYYHVLETICLRDMPEISTTFVNGKEISRGIYRKDRHQSPFSIQSKAGEAFEELFKGTAELKIPLVLSYSPFSESSMTVPRMQTIQQLQERAHKYYSEIDIVSPGHFEHSKLNSTEKNYEAGKEAELLIVCHGIKR